MNKAYCRAAFMVAIASLSTTSVFKAADVHEHQQYEEARNAINNHDVVKLQTILKQMPSLTTMKDSEGKTLMHHAAASVPFPESKYDVNLNTIFLPLGVVPFFITLILKNVPGIKTKIFALGALIYAIYRLSPYLYSYAFGDSVKEEYPHYRALLGTIASHTNKNNDVVDDFDKSPLEYALKTHSFGVIKLLENEGKGGKLLHPLTQPLSFHFEQGGTTVPEKSRIVFLGEVHNDLECIMLNFKAMESLAKPGDVILLEGLDFNSKEPRDVAKQIAGTLQGLTGFLFDDDSEALLNKAVKRSSALPSKVSIYGWESGNIGLSVWASVGALIAAGIVLPLLFSPKTLLIIGGVLGALDYTAFFEKTGISKIIKQLFIEIVFPFLVVTRNNDMIEVIKTIDAELPADNTIFVMAGAAHLPSLKGEDSCSCYTKSLQEYLEGKQYTILVPKHIQAIRAEICGVPA